MTNDDDEHSDDQQQQDTIVVRVTMGFLAATVNEKPNTRAEHHNWKYQNEYNSYREGANQKPKELLT